VGQKPDAASPGRSPTCCAGVTSPRSTASCPADDHPAPSRLHPRADQGRCAPEWLAARDRTRKNLLEVKLRKRSGYTFYNTSPYILPSLTGDSANVRANLLAYIDGFSDNIRDVFTPFGFEEQIQRLDDAFGAVRCRSWRGP